MAQQNQIVSNEELLLSNMMEIHAMIRILVRKNILTEEEILDEVKNLQKEMEEKIRRNSKEN